MFHASPELPKKSLEIKQDDKFFSKLMSRESSLANPSLRVYHGGIPSSVPFEWESQPGTPKHTFSQTTLPPLTPPPSYYSHIFSNNPYNKKRSEPNLIIRSLFPKTSTAKKDVLSSPPLSPSSSSSSRSSSNPRSTVRTIRCRQQKKQRKNSSSSSDHSSGDDDHAEETTNSPTWTMCFGIRG